MSTIGIKKSLTVGGRTFVGDEVDNVKCFQSFNSGSAPRHSVFREMGVATDYIVPALKKLTVWVHILSGESGSVTTQHNPGVLYGDTAVINSSAAPAAAIYAFQNFNVFSAAPNASRSELEGYSLPNGVAYTLKFEVPAGKYPHFKDTGANASEHMAWALEETA